MEVARPRQTGIRRQPSRDELLREVRTLRSQQQLLVEEVRQLLAAIAVYRDLAERALGMAEGSGNGPAVRRTGNCV